MLYSGQAVAVMSGDGAMVAWHDPYADESDVLAARIGGYVVAAGSEPPVVLADFRASGPPVVSGGHELVTGTDGVRVCLAHGMVAHWSGVTFGEWYAYDSQSQAPAGRDGYADETGAA